MPDFRISKLDSARRQLETAINLYFYERDVVSVHTLSAAAFNIMADIGRHDEGGKNTLRGIILDNFIKKEHRKFVRERLRQAENFFKHADKDSKAFLVFNPGQTEFLIWDSIVTYLSMTGESPPIFKVFHLWFGLQHADIYPVSDDQASILNRAKAAVQDMNRQAFFEFVLPLLYRLDRPQGSEV
ncbi:MAG: hypothetical protein HY913_16975 [Desulfomonile tiedjei]|nr:hypothetical protein [Desulfomonile tiedjei]